MILLSIVLSSIAALVGLYVGSLYWTFHLGWRWLRQALADDSALHAFWTRYLKPRGGISAKLKADGLVLDVPDPEKSIFCPIVLDVEATTFIRMRRNFGIAIGVLLTLCLGLSAFVSFAITFCFVCGVFLSIPLRNKGYALQSLDTFFRSTRIWMGADRETLDERGPKCIQGIVRVIESNEPIERPLQRNVAA